MPTAHVNGIDLEYVTEGDPANPALLLVMGLGAQLITWPDRFVTQLVERGFYVIRYDNRDSGLSTKFEGLPDLARFGGNGSPAPYGIEDMADDAAGLLSELGIAQAHVVGASMGGMIVQALAIHHAERVLTVCSIMSTTGDRAVGQPTGEALAALLRPVASSRHEAVAASVAGSRVIGSTGFPVDAELLITRAEAAYDRGYCPEGTARQLSAILSQADRTDALGQLTVPFLVVHGEADPLVQVSGGQATAAAVPESTLVLIPGMGHDLPEGAWGRIVDAIVANTERAG